MPLFVTMLVDTVGTVYPIAISAPFGGLFADGGGGGTSCCLPASQEQIRGYGTGLR